MCVHKENTNVCDWIVLGNASEGKPKISFYGRPLQSFELAPDDTLQDPLQPCITLGMCNLPTGKLFSSKGPWHLVEKCENCHSKFLCQVQSHLHLLAVFQTFITASSPPSPHPPITECANPLLRVSPSLLPGRLWDPCMFCVPLEHPAHNPELGEDCGCLIPGQQAILFSCLLQ